MKTVIKHLMNKLGFQISNLDEYSRLNFKSGYSQFGEDQIILNYFGLNNLDAGSYIDIGANHPYILNNTALLYERNFRGINIEPDPLMFKELVKYRNNDINLNIGIHSIKGELIYYQFENSVFNTFSEVESVELQKKGMKLVNRNTVMVDTYNSIVEKYLNNKPPTILFLDAEGVDEIIIRSIDYNKYAPKLICIETFAYGIGKKNSDLIFEIKKLGYEIYADTFVNTIFVKR